MHGSFADNRSNRILPKSPISTRLNQNSHNCFRYYFYFLGRMVLFKENCECSIESLELFYTMCWDWHSFLNIQKWELNILQAQNFMYKIVLYIINSCYWIAIYALTAKIKREIKSHQFRKPISRLTECSDFLEKIGQKLAS